MPESPTSRLWIPDTAVASDPEPATVPKHAIPLQPGASTDPQDIIRQLEAEAKRLRRKAARMARKRNRRSR